MRVRDLMPFLPGARLEGPDDREFTSMTCDSRRVSPGALFVAIKGQNVDGLSFLSSAVERGASVVMTQDEAAAPSRVARILVPDVREGMARASAALFGQPSSRMKVIGVTGTNGKTTVAFMVKAMLEAAGCKTGLIGTVRYEIGDRVIPAQRTTPESVDMQQLLSQMVRAGCKACVMEVSSHALEQKRVWGIEFDAVIFTNLTRDHLDFHGDMDSYFAAKSLLFTPQWPNPKKQTAIINIDDTYGQRLAANESVAVRMTYGIQQPAELRAVRLDLGANGSRFVVECSGRHFACRLPLIGRHNVYNALAAIGAAMAMEIPPAQIQGALNTMPPVPGRLETVPCKQGFSVYVDYAHTDDALLNVLTTLREIASGRILLTFGCGGGRDSGKRPRMGRVAAQLADLTILTSDNPRRESAEDICAQIHEGYLSVRPDGCRVELDRKRAIEEILRMAQPGDIVLIAGKGHETHQEFNDAVVPFDDRDYAAEALASIAG